VEEQLAAVELELRQFEQQELEASTRLQTGKEKLDLEQARKRAGTVVFSSLAFCDNGADSGQLGKFWEPIGKGEVLVKGTLGAAVMPELSPKPGEAVLERNRYSAFFNSELDAMLREKGIETLIIGGYSTNFCCDSTARDANFRDYRVIVLEDGTAPIALEETSGHKIDAEQVQSTVLANLRRGFAQVATVEEVLSYLFQNGTHPARKTASKLGVELI
jgi:nicotinamidase-related amidase